mmetsp:Transcript_36212/g.44159  ORF Transcript_36212/g.44159 Transcript_36212/m.44159 type:complete len:202 (+) Transcript_36212:746-1351(+)
MMIVCLEDCRMLLDFFKNHVTFIKGVKVLLANLEDVKELEPVAVPSRASTPPDFTVSTTAPGNIASRRSSLRATSDLDGITATQYVSQALTGTEISDADSFINDTRNSSMVIRDNHFEKQSIADFEPEEISYMLFLREPSRVEEKKLKAQKLAIMSLESAEEQQMRDHIDLLLREVEPLTRVGKLTMNDPNSLSEIMSVIR